jgi:hypothetical protein
MVKRMDDNKSSTNDVPLEDVGDQRHPAPYPKGPRRQLTQTWKDNVRKALAANAVADREPRDQAELANLVPVHKTAITKMFKAHTSRFADRVTDILCIPPPMVETQTVPAPDDEFDAYARTLTPEQRARALELLRIAFR